MLHEIDPGLCGLRAVSAESVAVAMQAVSKWDVPEGPSWLSLTCSLWCSDSGFRI